MSECALCEIAHLPMTRCSGAGLPGTGYSSLTKGHAAKLRAGVEVNYEIGFARRPFLYLTKVKSEQGLSGGDES